LSANVALTFDRLLIEGEDMKTRITIMTLIIIAMAVAAMAITGSSRGDANVVNTFLYSVPSFGIAPEQTVRFSVANPRTQEEGTEPVQVQAYIYDSLGRLVSQTDPVEVRPDQFRSLDFKRDDMRVAGEEGTGRVQVRAVIQVVLMDGSVRPVNLSVSMEVMDNRTGGTTHDVWTSGLGSIDVH
jgi:hypothetical protein